MLDLVGSCMPRGIHVGNLCKHMFVCGMPGSGKTTAVLSVLAQLFTRGIRFLVIEAAKTEYRVLKTLRSCQIPVARELAEKVQVHTPGNERVSPLRFNPLRLPHGIDVDEHVDLLLRCFRGAMPMFPPLPALLAEALELTYDEHPGQDTPPTMDELVEATYRVLTTKRYSPELKADLSAALEVRLGMLTRRTVGRAFRTIACIPDVVQMVDSYSIIELDTLESEVKCLITLFLLTAIQQHIRAHPEPDRTDGANPRLVIVIEEAHNVVGRTASVPTGDNQADPKACATELICRMLTEFRALGVGLILVDQFPSQMANEVIKATGAKLAFRQVDREDRDTLADAMLFGDLEYEEIARLLPGQAYLFAEGFHRAHRIRTPNLAQQLELPHPPSEAELLALVREDCWFRRGQMQRAADFLLRLRSMMDQYQAQKIAAHRHLRSICRQNAVLPRIRDGTARQRACRQILARLRRVGISIAAAYKRLERGPYAEARQLVIPEAEPFAELAALQRSLIGQFEGGIQPQARTLTEFIDRKAAQLQRSVFQKEE